MIGRISILLSVLSVITASLLLSPIPAANAYEIQIAQSGDTVRWKESCFHYTLHQDGAPDVDLEALRETVRASFDTWENVPCSYFYFEETADSDCTAIGFNQYAGNMNLLVWQPEDWQVDPDHAPSAMALTTLSYDDNSGRILDADIEFNAEYFDFGLSGVIDKADVENTATHEIGHMLGLEHSNIQESTMARTAETGDVDKRSLHSDDEEGLCFLYPEKDDPDVCLKPYCGLNVNCSNTCEEGGIPIETSAAEQPACTASPHLGDASDARTVWTFMIAILTSAL